MGERIQLHLKQACHVEDSTWIYGMQSEIANHFNVTQQRIEVGECSDATTVLINILEVEEVGQTSSKKLSSRITNKLNHDPDFLGGDFKVTSAEHVHAPTSTGKSQVGLWIGLTFLAAVLAAAGTAAYTKRVVLGQWYRAGKRKARAWAALEEEDDYENEGHVYGSDDQGNMFVSATETTYELEGMAGGSYDGHEPRSPDRTMQQRYMPSPTMQEVPKGDENAMMGVIPTVLPSVDPPNYFTDGADIYERQMKR